MTVQTPYPFQAWRDGVRPPKGWDCADAITDGWTQSQVNDFMRATVLPWVPPDPRRHAPEAMAPEPTPEPEPGPAVPVETAAFALSRMPKVQDLQHGSEVYIAQTLALHLDALCGGRVVRADGAFWAWGPTAWREIPEQKLRLAVHQFDGATVQGKAPVKIGKRMIDGILSEAGTILSEPDFFHDPAVALNASNVVISITDAGAIETRPHDPDDRFRFTIPAAFDLNTDMIPPPGSMLHTLLEGSFRGDPDAAEKMLLVGEILGAAAFGMATRLPQPKAFVLLGETANNGKSTIASLISCLLPDGSVSAIPPSAFEDEKRIINLAGKAANVADELSASAIAGETFKKAVTGDPIEGRDLYRSAMTFIPRAIQVYTTNTLPRFNGGLDRGLQRRLCVLTFSRTIPDCEIVPDIADRIKRDELDLLLGFAVAGAQRLTVKKGYTIPASSKEALHGWLMLDPVHEWFETRCRPCEAAPENGWPGTGLLYSDFKSWAVTEGHADRFLPPVNTFSQRLKAMPGVRIKRLSTGSVAAGIKLAGRAAW